MLETKNAKVRRLVANEEYMEALRICKDWDYEDQIHRDILRRGYECRMYPQFYSQLGYDTEEEYKKAISILKALY